MSELYNRKFDIYRELFNSYLYEAVPKGMKVLDVGCNGGQLGKLLQELKQCCVFGVDISPAAIARAKKNLTAAEVMDITRDRFPYCNEKFDVIIFGDILEHIIDPVAALKKFEDYLKPDGSILISLPNVANIIVRTNLLFGKWEYQQSGILDDTHIRFYTIETAKKLVNKADLTLNKIEISPGFSFGLSKIFPSLRWLTDRLCKLRPSLFAYQFIILAKKNMHDMDNELQC